MFSPVGDVAASKADAFAATDRFADLLLRHLQRAHGSIVGASRYVEVLSLVDACYHFGKKYREHCTILYLLNPDVLPKFGLVSDIFWS